MANLEKNFVSAVVYLGNEKEDAVPFLSMLTEHLEARFAQYELVFVEDSSRDGTEQAVKEFLAEMKNPPSVTMIHMSIRQGLEKAMNAGVDMAIGDFVYQFDSMKVNYPAELIDKAYDTSLAGNDIVTVSPEKNRKWTSALFYKLFNSASGSRYKLRTDAFCLLSRRAINRVNALSATRPYRKAAYAACGLKMETISFSGKQNASSEALRISRAVDSLALYTNLGYKASFGVSMLFLLATLAGVIYTLVISVVKSANPEGWVTTMLLLSGGFFGVFLVLSLILKYLSLLVELVFNKQQYLVESVEKIA